MTDMPATTCAIHGCDVQQYETGRGGYTVLCPRCEAALAPVPRYGYGLLPPDDPSAVAAGLWSPSTPDPEERA